MFIFLPNAEGRGNLPSLSSICEFSQHIEELDKFLNDIAKCGQKHF